MCTRRLTWPLNSPRTPFLTEVLDVSIFQHDFYAAEEPPAHTAPPETTKGKVRWSDAGLDPCLAKLFAPHNNRQPARPYPRGGVASSKPAYLLASLRTPRTGFGRARSMPNLPVSCNVLARMELAVLQLLQTCE